MPSDTALALRPDALVEEFGSLPSLSVYAEKPAEVRALCKESIARIRQGIQVAKAAVEADLGPAIADANRRHKDLCAERRDALAPLGELQTKADRVLVGYDDADVRIAREAEAAYAKALLANEQAQEAAFAAGDDAAAVSVPDVQQPTGLVKTEGLHFRETYRVEATDMLRFLRYVLDKEPGLATWVQLNEPMVNKIVTAQRGALSKPGLRVRVTKTPVTPRRFGGERMSDERLKFAKPERFIDDELLRAYSRLHGACEVEGCRRPPAPEPHHLVPRARGRDDRHANLLRLCVEMHLEYHQLGGRRWFEKYGARLLDEARFKVMAALRMEE